MKINNMMGQSTLLTEGINKSNSTNQIKGDNNVRSFTSITKKKRYSRQRTLHLKLEKEKAENLISMIRHTMEKKR
jgi:hypothetical protein